MTWWAWFLVGNLCGIGLSVLVLYGIMRAAARIENIWKGVL